MQENATDTAETSTRLDDQLCFALYAASRAVTGFYRPILERLGITYPQYLVLLALWERDGQTVKELGAALRLDYGTLSPLLKRMEGAGIVRRERRADDERSVRVLLADRGITLSTCAEGIMPAVVAATGLDGDDLVAMRTALLVLADAVGRASDAAAAGRDAASG